MKKQLLAASMILLFVAVFTACKKQDDATQPLRTKMLGKWQVNKIEVTTGNNTVTTNYAATDYLDFRDNESDDVELGLGTTRAIGKHSSGIDNKFYLDFTSKDLDCTVSTISETQFKFTGVVVGSSPQVTETYYLSR